MHIEKSTVGSRLKLLRENCGYTQQQIANTLNIDRSTYAYYETGKTFPDINTFFALARIFNVEILDILEPEKPALEVEDSGQREMASPAVSAIMQNTSHIYELSKKEKQLICSYRAVMPERKDAVFQKLMKTFEEDAKSE